MSDSTNNPVPLGEIIQGPSPFEQFLENNQKKIAIAAVAIGLGIGSFMVYRTIEADHALEAGVAYASAKDIADLEKVRSSFSDTPAAATAALSLSEKQWDAGQQDEAISTLRALIASHPDHPVAAIAQNALGQRLLAQGKTGDASVAFQAVIDRQDHRYLAPAATIALADIAKNEGDLEKAEELYKKVSLEYSGSPFANLAADRVKFLRFTAPVEIEPPPVITDPPASLIAPDSSSADSSASTGNPLLDSIKITPAAPDAEQKDDKTPTTDPVNPPSSNPSQPQ